MIISERKTKRVRIDRGGQVSIRRNVSAILAADPSMPPFLETIVDKNSSCDKSKHAVLKQTLLYFFLSFPFFRKHDVRSKRETVQIGGIKNDPIYSQEQPSACMPHTYLYHLNKYRYVRVNVFEKPINSRGVR